MYFPLWFCLVLLAAASHAKPKASTGHLDASDVEPLPPRYISLQQYLQEVQHAASKAIQGAGEGTHQHLAAVKKKHIDFIRQHFYQSLTPVSHIKQQHYSLHPNRKPLPFPVTHQCSGHECSYVPFKPLRKPVRFDTPRPHSKSPVLHLKPTGAYYRQYICRNFPSKSYIRYLCNQHTPLPSNHSPLRPLIKTKPIPETNPIENANNGNTQVDLNILSTDRPIIERLTTKKAQQHITLPEKLFNIATKPSTSSGEFEQSFKSDIIKESNIKLENEILGLTTMDTPESRMKNDTHLLTTPKSISEVMPVTIRPEIKKDEHTLNSSNPKNNDGKSLVTPDAKSGITTSDSTPNHLTKTTLAISTELYIQPTESSYSSTNKVNGLKEDKHTQSETMTTVFSKQSVGQHFTSIIHENEEHVFDNSSDNFTENSSISERYDLHSPNFSQTTPDQHSLLEYSIEKSQTENLFTQDTSYHTESTSVQVPITTYNWQYESLTEGKESISTEVTRNYFRDNILLGSTNIPNIQSTQDTGFTFNHNLSEAIGFDQTTEEFREKISSTENNSIISDTGTLHLAKTATPFQLSTQNTSYSDNLEDNFKYEQSTLKTDEILTQRNVIEGYDISQEAKTEMALESLSTNTANMNIFKKEETIIQESYRNEEEWSNESSTHDKLENNFRYEQSTLKADEILIQRNIFEGNDISQEANTELLLEMLSTNTANMNIFKKEEKIIHESNRKEEEWSNESSTTDNLEDSFKYEQSTLNTDEILTQRNVIEGNDISQEAKTELSLEMLSTNTANMKIFKKKEKIIDESNRNEEEWSNESSTSDFPQMARTDTGFDPSYLETEKFRKSVKSSHTSANIEGNWAISGVGNVSDFTQNVGTEQSSTIVINNTFNYTGGKTDREVNQLEFTDVHEMTTATWDVELKTAQTTIRNLDIIELIQISNDDFTDTKQLSTDGTLETSSPDTTITYDLKEHAKHVLISDYDNEGRTIRIHDNVFNETTLMARTDSTWPDNTLTNQLEEQTKSLKTLSDQHEKLLVELTTYSNHEMDQTERTVLPPFSDITDPFNVEAETKSLLITPANIKEWTTLEPENNNIPELARTEDQFYSLLQDITATGKLGDQIKTVQSIPEKQFHVAITDTPLQSPFSDIYYPDNSRELDESTKYGSESFEDWSTDVIGKHHIDKLNVARTENQFQLLLPDGKYPGPIEQTTYSNDEDVSYRIDGLEEQSKLIQSVSEKQEESSVHLTANGSNFRTDGTESSVQLLDSNIKGTNNLDVENESLTTFENNEEWTTHVSENDNINTHINQLARTEAQFASFSQDTTTSSNEEIQDKSIQTTSENHNKWPVPVSSQINNGNKYMAITDTPLQSSFSDTADTNKLQLVDEYTTNSPNNYEGWPTEEFLKHHSDILHIARTETEYQSLLPDVTMPGLVKVQEFLKTANKIYENEAYGIGSENTENPFDALITESTTKDGIHNHAKPAQTTTNNKNQEWATQQTNLNFNSLPDKAKTDTPFESMYSDKTISHSLEEQETFLHTTPEINELWTAKVSGKNYNEPEHLAKPDTSILPLFPDTTSTDNIEKHANKSFETITENNNVSEMHLTNDNNGNIFQFPRTETSFGQYIPDATVLNDLQEQDKTLEITQGYNEYDRTVTENKDDITTVINYSEIPQQSRAEHAFDMIYPYTTLTNKFKDQPTTEDQTTYAITNLDNIEEGPTQLSEMDNSDPPQLRATDTSLEDLPVYSSFPELIEQGKSFHTTINDTVWSTLTTDSEFNEHGQIISEGTMFDFVSPESRNTDHWHDEPRYFHDNPTDNEELYDQVTRVDTYTNPQHSEESSSYETTLSAENIVSHWKDKIESIQNTNEDVSVTTNQFREIEFTTKSPSLSRDNSFDLISPKIINTEETTKISELTQNNESWNGLERDFPPQTTYSNWFLDKLSQNTITRNSQTTNPQIMTEDESQMLNKLEVFSTDSSAKETFGSDVPTEYFNFKSFNQEYDYESTSHKPLHSHKNDSEEGFATVPPVAWEMSTIGEVQTSLDHKILQKTYQAGVVKYTSEIEDTTNTISSIQEKRELPPLDPPFVMLLNNAYRKIRSNSEKYKLSNDKDFDITTQVLHRHREIRSSKTSDTQLTTSQNASLADNTNSTTLEASNILNPSNQYNGSGDDHYTKTEGLRKFNFSFSLGDDLKSPAGFPASTILELLPVLREGYKNNAFSDDDKKVIRSIFGDIRTLIEEEKVSGKTVLTADLLMGDETSRFEDFMEDSDYSDSIENIEDSLLDKERKLKRSNKNFQIATVLFGKVPNDLKNKINLMSSSKNLRKIRSSGPQPLSEAAAILALLAENSGAVQLDRPDDEDDDEYEYYEDREDDEYTGDDSRYAYHDPYDEDYSEPSFTELIKLARKHRERKAMEP